MENSVQRFQPSSLSNEELLKYVRLHNINGLPKHWVDELLVRFERMLDRASTAEELLAHREEELQEQLPFK